MNSMRFFLSILFVVFFLSKGAFAQLSQGGNPLETVALKSAKIPVIVLPKIDNNTLLKNSLTEINESLQLKPFRFAEPVDVKLNTLNSGVWTTAEDGTQIWVIKIHSENAHSLNLIFDDFNLPEGNRLFLYNENKSSVLGAFTSFNNNLYNKFATLPVAGEEITVQYEIPRNAVKNRDFEIITVNHDFVDILKRNERRPFFPTIAGTCNVDINCGLGDKWSDIKDAVCRMFVNGRELCTGTLINNVEETQKPYVISAAHCYDSWTDPATTVYSFNYESPYCSPLDGDPSRAISGAVMKAQFDSLDFALVEMNLIPPPEYRPFYAGWDNTGILVDTSVTIHHPWGDIKKITIDNDKPVFDDFSLRLQKKWFYKNRTLGTGCN
jgi:lysyl endopeptidase